ncbi:EAL domain-containing protein [Aurantimonas sp. Leaf443]|uniref:putative bifunctional diguanylate cyclase/phosphodiesterase n=1 Tax=Aurantimonas sp. Leaf443 TaxID=1736378 RepID=UPI001FCD9D7C|nr:EAL domain-containing protein [Aurantimonas sp. Leaf443]
MDSELAMAQYGELRRQIPLLYALLSVNAVAVAYTHQAVAPPVMSTWIPAFLVLACLARLAMWLLRPAKAVAPGEAVTLLRRTTILGTVLALAFIVWSLKLGDYGGEREHAHVALFIAITVIGCIFCLMHLPQAALVVTIVVTGPYLAYYVAGGDSVYLAIAINIVLVTMVMIRVLLNSFRGFETLIRTQAETTRLNREVTLLAHTDMLTGLPNRRLFFAELESELERCRDAGTEFALGVIDLDRFKAANDTFGHLLGDEVLETVGRRLRAVFGPERMVARLGGDEFAFFLPARGDAACRLADEACIALSEPFRFGDVTISIGASCGVATTRDVHGTARSLYEGADYALYNSKNFRRGLATLYSAEHENRIRSERAIEAALQAADFEAETEIHLQPIVCVRRGTVLAVEALARWTSPRVGPVRPDIFIPLAERTGRIHRLTLTLLAKALACLDRLPGSTKLSFNLSAHDLTSGETVLGMVSLIRASCPDPSRLILELTETAVLRDFSAAEDAILLLRALGVQIALDDFGTGQSSLSYLHRLPIDNVKIDRSFLMGSGTPSGRQLLTAIVALCKSLNMRCIAEGVEEEAQLAVLSQIGCDAYQGYVFARPMPLDAFLAEFAPAIETQDAAR